MQKLGNNMGLTKWWEFTKNIYRYVFKSLTDDKELFNNIHAEWIYDKQSSKIFPL